MYAALSPRRRSRSDYGGKGDEIKVEDGNNEKSSNFSRFRIGSFSGLGARVRSYTSSNNNSNHSNVRLSPKAQRADSAHLQDLASPRIQRRSFSGLSSHLIPVKHVEPGERLEVDDEKKDRRRSMRIFSSVTNHSPKRDHLMSKDGRPSSSVDSSSLENNVDDSVHQFYIATYPETSNDILEQYANWKPGKQINDQNCGVEAESHVSSARAYLEGDESVLTNTTTSSSSTNETLSGARPNSKSSKFSVSALRRRWSKSDLLDTNMEEARNPESLEAHSQDLSSSTSQSTFNLRSFRNVREGSSVSTEVLPIGTDGHARSRSTSMYSSDERATNSFRLLHTSAAVSEVPYSNSTTGLVTAMPSNSQQTTSQLQAKHLSSFSFSSTTASPMTSKPGSPRPESRRASGSTAPGGSISVGQFLRGAARSRPDLTCAIDDEPGSPIQPVSPTITGLSGIGIRISGHGRTSSMGGGTASPYRPLTPLGEGARSPGEELALLEADLAKARTNSSSIYLAQLEEQQNAIKRRQQRLRQQERRRSGQNSSSVGLQESPLLNNASGIANGARKEDRGYFPQFDQINEGTYQAHPTERTQSPRSPQTLFERLVQVEQEALREQINGMLYPARENRNEELAFSRSISPISR